MKPPLRRCALYTRKSSEEGLDQEFNSLDAQREACESYVKSQSGEGWKALPAHYDDGGISGGTMERPALQRLLADIAAGKVDVVVVYKIDRLTRSLADFARIVEIFERHDVSFVSVTQAFNTTSSMGRLTLNVLLSFAQFEREVTGERIRDKIAASKKKSMWMGGAVPLGYDIPVNGSRMLIVNDAEAALVRRIFALYLELGSVHAVATMLSGEGLVSKRRVSRGGKTLGGLPFSRGALFHLLRNRLYLGEIPHREEHHPGLHAAIVSPELFNAAQRQLSANARRRSGSRTEAAASLLTGRIFDTDGQPMSPAFAHGRNGRLYRYYVSAPLQQGKARATDDRAPRRISAPAIESALSTALARLLPDAANDPLTSVVRIETHESGVDLLLPINRLARLRRGLGSGETADPEAGDRRYLRLRLPLRLRIRAGKTEVLGGTEPHQRPDPTLVRALRTAHALVEWDRSGAPSLSESPDTPWRRKLVRLAFLAPDLQSAILEGRQPKGMNLAALMVQDVPLSWAEQRRVFGMENRLGATNP